MCSLDHKVMLTLKLGPWRDDAIGGVLLTDLSRNSDVQSQSYIRAPKILSTLMPNLMARLTRGKKQRR
ncbi:MAG: hypothetical protein JKY94_12050 [Rhodobacteraceae bacterium]|nr:hypothetical protein [Paracoccaceae bacterium]